MKKIILQKIFDFQYQNDLLLQFGKRYLRADHFLQSLRFEDNRR